MKIGNKILSRFALAAFAFLSMVPAQAAEDLGGYMMHHLANGHHWKVTPWGPEITLPSGWMVGGINLSISLHVLIMLLAFAALVLIALPAVKRQRQAPINKIGHIFEVFVVFIRDEVVKPNLGEEDTRKWLPFFSPSFSSCSPST